MGFFDKLFGGKHDAAPKFAGEKMVVKAPIDGTVIPLEQIPDETFATAILGPGCGIEPPATPCTPRLTAPSRRWLPPCTPSASPATTASSC